MLNIEYVLKKKKTDCSTFQIIIFFIYAVISLVLLSVAPMYVYVRRIYSTAAVE